MPVARRLIMFFLDSWWGEAAGAMERGVPSWSSRKVSMAWWGRRSRGFRSARSRPRFRTRQAAQRVQNSRSAVSEQVHLLEQEIGFALCRRSPRGVDATEQGRLFLCEAERVVGDVLSLSDTARRLRGSPSDTLIIGMGSGMAQI